MQSGPALTCLNHFEIFFIQIGRLGLTLMSFPFKDLRARSIRVPGLPLKALREAVESGNPSTLKRYTHPSFTGDAPDAP